MVEHVVGYTVPAAYALLPKPMRSAEATALLVAIGLQESGFSYRFQAGGPALGFWQFEVAGVRSVLEHDRTYLAIAQALASLRYDHTVDAALIHPVLAHNDVLAACFARCLLWAAGLPLAGPDSPDGAWELYRAAWRPGKPRRSTWNNCYRSAWLAVSPNVPRPLKT